MSEEIKAEEPQQQPPKKDEEFDALAYYYAQPRYDVGLQKPDDLCCYKDFHHTNTLSQAKEEADKAAAETGRATIVYDRKEFNIIYRVAAANQPQPEVKKPEPIKRGRGKRKGQ